MEKLVNIIVVNWNSGDLLERLINSFQELPDNKLINQFIVVDNNSTDNSINYVQNLKSISVKVINNPENLGFSKACNLGAKNSNAKYLLFLNPDTWVYEGALSKSIQFLENDNTNAYGACGIQLVNHLNIPNRSCARIPTFTNFVNSALGLSIVLPSKFPGVLLREWSHDKTTDIGHVIGAFYLVRNSVFQELEGFDERYFLYYEDLDFSTKLQKSGYKIGYIAEARAVHIGGGCSQRVKVKRLSYSYLSKIKYIYKHFPIYQFLPLLLFILFVEPIMRFSFYILQASPKEAIISVLGYFQFLFKLIFSSTPRRQHG